MIDKILQDKDFWGLPEVERVKVINFVLERNPDFVNLPDEEKGKVRQFLIKKIQNPLPSQKTISYLPSALKQTGKELLSTYGKVFTGIPKTIATSIEEIGKGKPVSQAIKRGIIRTAQGTGITPQELLRKEYTPKPEETTPTKAFWQTLGVELLGTAGDILLNPFYHPKAFQGYGEILKTTTRPITEKLIYNRVLQSIDKNFIKEVEAGLKEAPDWYKKLPRDERANLIRELFKNGKAQILLKNKRPVFLKVEAFLKTPFGKGFIQRARGVWESKGMTKEVMKDVMRKPEVRNVLTQKATQPQTSIIPQVPIEPTTPEVITPLPEAVRQVLPEIKPTKPSIPVSGEVEAEARIPIAKPEEIERQRKIDIGKEKIEEQIEKEKRGIPTLYSYLKGRISKEGAISAGWDIKTLRKDYGIKLFFYNKEGTSPDDIATELVSHNIIPQPPENVSPGDYLYELLKAERDGEIVLPEAQERLAELEYRKQELLDELYQKEFNLKQEAQEVKDGETISRDFERIQKNVEKEVNNIPSDTIRKRAVEEITEDDIKQAITELEPEDIMMAKRAIEQGFKVPPLIRKAIEYIEKQEIPKKPEIPTKPKPETPIVSKKEQVEIETKPIPKELTKEQITQLPRQERVSRLQKLGYGRDEAINISMHSDVTAKVLKNNITPDKAVYDTYSNDMIDITKAPNITYEQAKKILRRSEYPREVIKKYSPQEAIRKAKAEIVIQTKEFTKNVSKLVETKPAGIPELKEPPSTTQKVVEKEEIKHPVLTAEQQKEVEELSRWIRKKHPEMRLLDVEGISKEIVLGDIKSPEAKQIDKELTNIDIEGIIKEKEGKYGKEIQEEKYNIPGKRRQIDNLSYTRRYTRTIQSFSAPEIPKEWKEKPPTPLDVASYLASTFSPIRKLPQEKTYIVLLDRNKKIIKTLFHTKGLFTEAPISIAETIGTALNTPDVKYIYFIHNHPGGFPQSSFLDKKIIIKIASKLREKDIKVYGIVIGGKKYGFYDPLSDSELIFNIKPSLKKQTIPVEEKYIQRFKDYKINNPEKLKNFPLKKGVIVCNAKLNVSSISDFDIDKADIKDIIEETYKAVEKGMGDSIFYKAENPDTLDKIKKVISIIHQEDPSLLFRDIFIKDKSYASEIIKTLSKEPTVEELGAVYIPKHQEVKNVRDRIISKFDVEAPFKNIGAPETGFRIKNISSEIDMHHEKAGEFIKKISKIKLPQGIDYTDITFMAERPSLIKDHPEVKKAVNEVRKLYEDYYKELNQMGWLDRPFPETLIERRKKQIAELKTLLGKTKDTAKRTKIENLIKQYQKDIDFLEKENIKFVSIPAKIIMEKIEQQPQLADKLLSILPKWGRETLTVKDLVDAGILTRREADIRRIMAEYVDRMGRKLAYAKVFKEAEKEGLIKDATEAPENYVKFSARIIPQLRGKRLHPVLNDMLERYFTTQNGLVPLNSFLGFTKMLQFFNPLFLPYYDLWQSTATGTLTNIKAIKYVVQGIYDVLKKTDNYWEAVENGISSKPYSLPYKEFSKEVEQQIKRLDNKFHILKDLALPHNWLKEAYTTSWNIAWKLDHTVRMITYNYLKAKGFSPRQSAQLSALFHSDYASVPPTTRKLLNKILFTPTFKITMTKLYTEIVKSSFKIAREVFTKLPKRQKPKINPEDFIKGRALLYILTGITALGAILKKWGFKEEQWGRRYVKEVQTEKGKKELVITLAHPFNIPMRYYYRIKGIFEPTSINKIERTLNTFKWDLHPLYRVGIELLHNRGRNGNPIYNPVADNITQAKQILEYAMGEIIGLLGSFIGKHRREKSVEDFKVLQKEIGRFYSIILRPFVFSYIRESKEKRKRWAILRARREFKKFRRRNPPKTPEEAERLIKEYREKLKAIKKQFE